MSVKLINRARMTVSGTPGTGDVTLNAASVGFQSFAAAGLADTNTFSYVLEDGLLWEVGVGTYHSGGSFTRTTVTASSSGTSKITATSSAVVYGTIRAEDIIQASSLATVATSGAYSDLSGKPSLATVATSGSYNDLSNKPSIPGAGVTPTIVQSNVSIASGLGAVNVTLSSAPTAGNVLVAFITAGIGYAGLSLPAGWKNLEASTYQSCSIHHVGVGESATQQIAYSSITATFGVVIFEVSGVNMPEIVSGIDPAGFCGINSLLLGMSYVYSSTPPTISGMTSNGTAVYGSSLAISGGHTVATTDVVTTDATMSLNLVPR